MARLSAVITETNRKKSAPIFHALRLPTNASMALASAVTLDAMGFVSVLMDLMRLDVAARASPILQSLQLQHEVQHNERQHNKHKPLVQPHPHRKLLQLQQNYSIVKKLLLILGYAGRSNSSILLTEVAVSFQTTLKMASGW